MYVKGTGSTSSMRKGSRVTACGARDVHPLRGSWIFLVVCSGAGTSSRNIVLQWIASKEISAPITNGSLKGSNGTRMLLKVLANKS